MLGKEIITENKKRKIVLSPHFDDFAISLGGTALIWNDKKRDVEDWVVFSKSNYLPNDESGKKNNLQNPVKYISSVRYKEELRAAKKLGAHKVKLLGGKEVPVRETVSTLKFHKHGFPYGFDKERDESTLKEIKEKIEYIFWEDVQIYIPLAIQDHTDHLITRRAASTFLLKKKRRSQIFFYEDIPYAIQASKEEKKMTEAFIESYGLIPVNIPIDIEKKVEIFNCYTSQNPERYKVNTSRRAWEIGKSEPCERLYYMPEYDNE